MCKIDEKGRVVERCTELHLYDMVTTKPLKMTEEEQAGYLAIYKMTLTWDHEQLAAAFADLSIGERRHLAQLFEYWQDDLAAPYSPKTLCRARKRLKL